MGAANLDSITMIGDTPHASNAHIALCEWLFQQIGTINYIPESLMNEASATHATCNALTILAVDAVAEGLPRSKAMQLVAQSLRSAAAMIEDGVTPESMEESMSIPKGITINALLDMEKGHVKPAVSDATRNAIRYSRTMT